MSISKIWFKRYHAAIVANTPSNEKIIAGECAVPGIIALIGLFKNKEYLNKLALNSNAKVLLFGCEGLTDTAMYKKLLDDGLKKI